MRKKPPPVDYLPWKFGNPIINNQDGRNALYRANNAVLDTVASSCFENQYTYNLTQGVSKSLVLL